MAFPSVSSTAPAVVTLIVHGTFAADESWWKLGDGTSSTFADRLEQALSRRGLAGTVWRPALQAEMSYKDFAWSGANRHRDRVAGARQLTDSLKLLARKLSRTPASPLEVNFVAHSHGGNVTLEALKNLPAGVRARRVVLLGTPLICHYPVLRPVRLLVALFLLTIIGVMLLAVGMELVGVDYSADFSPLDLLAWTVVLVTLYGWLFWLLAAAFDFSVRWAVRLVPVLFGRGAGQAYGPPPKLLGERLRGRPPVLLTSHQDEADLILHLGAAPRKLYLEEVRTRWHGIKRVAEMVFLRPFVDGIVLKLLEVVLERFVLGFSWLAVLFRDYEMAKLGAGGTYPSSVLTRLDVTPDLLPVLREELSRSPLRLVESAFPAEGQADGDRRVASVRNTLQLLGREIGAQVRLRHSMYYHSTAVIDRIADLLTAP